MYNVRNLDLQDIKQNPNKVVKTSKEMKIDSSMSVDSETSLLSKRLFLSNTAPEVFNQFCFRNRIKLSLPFQQF